jgi:MFS transporter, DHA1 family, inner membrane transport protein
VADHIVPERRGQALGKVTTAFSLASVVGLPSALWLAHHSNLGWRAPFAAISGLAVLLLLVLSREIPKHPHPSYTSETMAVSATPAMPVLSLMKRVLSDRNHQIALLFTALMTGSAFVIIPYITIYATQNVGFPEHKCGCCTCSAAQQPS